MENISKINVYRYLISYESEMGLSEKVRSLLEINLTILDGLEELFLKENQNIYGFNFEIREILRRNVSRINELQIPENIDVRNLVEEIVKLVGKESEEKNVFGSLLKRLSKFNHIHIKDISDFFNNRFAYIDRESIDVENYVARLKAHFQVVRYTKVFLSYAYADKLYTGALYVYFLGQGIELYIDWMHNPYLKEGRVLKERLDYELRQAEQFLFLRSPNSELQIGSNYYVRPWCAWELGNYYEHLRDEKYYISLYTIPSTNNMLLDGLKMLSSICGGRLTER